MNQDYQLSTNPQGNGDFWTQSGQSILANAGIAPGQSGTTKLERAKAPLPP